MARNLLFDFAVMANALKQITIVLQKWYKCWSEILYKGKAFLFTSCISIYQVSICHFLAVFFSLYESNVIYIQVMFDFSLLY